MSVGGSQAGPSRNNAEIPPFPGKEKMPMNLLLHPLHFEQLFTLMQTLSDLRINGLPHPKAQILSRRVWDILMLLPTNPTVKEKLQNITEGTYRLGPFINYVSRYLEFFNPPPPQNRQKY